jgi:hypothetical protein
VLTGGTYGLLRDDIPPVIRKVRIPGRVPEKAGAIYIPVSDRGSGIDEQHLIVHLNGSELECEYDGDRNRVIVDELGALQHGTNVLDVTARDRAGNVANRIFSFFIK